MNIEKRLRMCRLIEKIEKDESYASKLGIRNVSAFRLDGSLHNKRKK